MPQAKPKPKLILSLLAALLVAVAVLGFAPASSHAANSPTIEPNEGYAGIPVSINASGLGTIVDKYDDTKMYVEFVDAMGTKTKATVTYPVAQNWNDTNVNFTVPSGLPNNAYDVFVVSNGNRIGPLKFHIIAYATPANVNGTPDYTSDYIIANTQSINVSDAIRQIAQGFLLPSKDTIIELGSYLQDALVLKLDLGSSDTDGSAYKKLEPIWSISHNLVNSLFLLAIVFIGIMITLRMQNRINRYWLRNIIPRGILALVLINLSLLLSQALMDFFVIFTHVIRDSFSTMPSGQQFATALLGDLRLNIFVLAMLAFYLLTIALMSCALVMMILRTIAIWLMVAIAPFVFMGVLFPFTSHAPIVWLKRFMQMLLVGPIATFLLFIGYQLSISVKADFENADLIRAFIGIATLTLLLFIPSFIGSIFDYVQKVLPTNKNTTNNTSTTTKTSNQNNQDNSTSIKNKIGLQDGSLADKIQTIKIPLTDQFQKRFQSLISGKPNISTPADSGTAAVNSAASDARQTATNASTASSSEATTTERKQGPSRDDSAGKPQIDLDRAKEQARAKNNVLFDQATPNKLFDTAPPQLVINWLNDKGKIKIVSAGLVASKGNLENNKANAIIDSQPGKQLLSDMYGNGSKDEKNASSNLISNIFLASPDRIKTIVDATGNNAPPIKQAAQTVLEAGIVRLGQRLQENPGDEKLQKAAERVVMSAPHLLSSTLANVPDQGPVLINAGIMELAATLGATLAKLTDRISPRVMFANPTPDSKEYFDVGQLASQIVVYPALQLSRLGTSHAGAQFVASAALSNTPQSTEVKQKLVGELEQSPSNISLQAIAAEIFKHTPPAAVAALPVPIATAAREYLKSPAMQQKPDPELIQQYLTATSGPDLLQHESLSGNLLKQLNLPDLLKHIGIENHDKNTLELPSKIVMASPVVELVEKQKDLFNESQKTLPYLEPQNPALAAATAVKLVADTPANFQPDLHEGTRALAKKTLQHEGNQENLPTTMKANAARNLGLPVTDSANNTNTPAAVQALKQSPMSQPNPLDTQQSADLLQSANAISTDLAAKIKANAARNQGLPATDNTEIAKTPDALQTLKNTPMSQLKPLDTKQSADLLQYANANPNAISPDMAAKMVMTLPIEDLGRIPQTVSAMAENQLQHKDSSQLTHADIELAARVIAATPKPTLSSLQSNTFKVGAQLSGQDLSQATRDQVQITLSAELEKMIAPQKSPLNDPELNT